MEIALNMLSALLNFFTEDQMARKTEKTPVLHRVRETGEVGYFEREEDGGRFIVDGKKRRLKFGETLVKMKASEARDFLNIRMR